jgi:hypothetical protein
VRHGGNRLESPPAGWGIPRPPAGWGIPRLPAGLGFPNLLVVVEIGQLTALPLFVLGSLIGDAQVLPLASHLVDAVGPPSCVVAHVGLSVADVRFEHIGSPALVHEQCVPGGAVALSRPLITKYIERGCSGDRPYLIS